MTKRQENSIPLTICVYVTHTTINNYREKYEIMYLKTVIKTGYFDHTLSSSRKNSLKLIYLI